MEINLTDKEMNEFKQDGFLEIRYDKDFYIYLEDNDLYCELNYQKKKYAFDSDDLEKLDEKDILRWSNGEPRCPSCGTSMIYNFDYCPKCGQKLNWYEIN